LGTRCPPAIAESTFVWHVHITTDQPAKDPVIRYVSQWGTNKHIITELSLFPDRLNRQTPLLVA
jgi:hypothetical protein